MGDTNPYYSKQVIKDGNIEDGSYENVLKQLTGNDFEKIQDAFLIHNPLLVQSFNTKLDDSKVCPGV